MVNAEMIELTVYETFYNDRRHAFGLSEEEVRQIILSSWAYGDPELPDSHALGNRWANSEAYAGWQIRSRIISAHQITGKVLSSYAAGETVHLTWQCSQCDSSYSEDIEISDSSPWLLSCTHCFPNHKNLYHLVHFEQKNE